MSGWVAGAAVAGSVISGVMSSDASRRASNTQAAAATQASNNQLQATQAANQMQWQMYQQNLINQSPYMQGGQMGMAALTGAMFGAPNQTGVNPQQTGQPNATTQPVSNMATTQQVSPTGSPTMQTQQVNPSTGLNTTPGSTNAAPGAQTATAGGGTGITTPNIPVMSSDPTQIGQTGNYGASAGQLAGAGSAFSGQLGKQFSNADLNSQLAPNYQFQLDQGEQQLKASLAATGMLQTGEGLKDINNYAQNYAGNAYQNAFNNWNTQQNQLYNRLQGMIAPGSAAASAAGGAATSAGSGIAQTGMLGASAANNYMTQSAAANAAGTMGSNNALTGAIGSGLTGYNNANQMGMNQQLQQAQISYLNNPPGSSGYGSGLSYPAPAGYGQYAGQPAPANPAGYEP